MTDREAIEELEMYWDNDTALRTTAFAIAIKALREREEQSKGCPWCKAEYTIVDDDFGQPIRPDKVKFCWNCGRMLGRL